MPENPYANNGNVEFFGGLTWKDTQTDEEKREYASRGGKATAAARIKAGQERRRRVLELLADGKTVDEALAVVEVSRRTWRKWREQNPAFAAEADAVRNMGEAARQAPDADLSFITWRKNYLDSETTWFQAQIVEALEDDSLGGGTITLVLFPPEHGKTTTIEDYITWKLATNKGYRVTYGSESQAHARKALRRVRNRLEFDGPYPRLVRDFGPFAPPPRSWDHHGNQPWGQDFFDVAGRTKEDERDYSMVALGFGSQIAGSRTDLLVGDDLTSMRNVAQSEKLLETFRQDWLSRPGTKGRTVIIGTRVADGDMYDLMEQADLPDKIVRFKAHDPTRITAFDTPWLWPQRYSEAEYAKMRKNVGEAAWARNYQQQPRAAGDSTFTEALIEKCSIPLRSVNANPPEGTAGIIIGLDPGFGINAVVALGARQKACAILGGRKDIGLTNNEQIFAACEQAYLDARGTTKLPWLHLTIEDKAFQKGLLDDAALHALQKEYGFSMNGHQTGSNKYDENIGIPGMARDFRREVVELPGADDEDTERFRSLLDAQLIRWRPHVKGTALEMDLVMALWFGWLWWSKFRDALHVHHSNHHSLETKALPWRPTVLPGGMTRMPA